MAFVSGKVIKLQAKLNPADTSLTADIDVGVTTGRIYFVSSLQEEWIDFTGVSASGSNFSYTGLTRGLSQIADPATAGTGLTWVAGNSGVVVAMHDQLIDKTVATQSLQEAQTYATTTARDSALGADGVPTFNYVDIKCTDTGLFYNYNTSTAVWEVQGNGVATGNASTTAAGSVRIADSAQSIAGTDTESGTTLSVIPSDIAANNQSDTFKYAADAGANDTYVITLTPALTAYTTGQGIRFKANTINTGACTINIDGLGAKSIKDRAGNDPVNGLIAANDFVDLYYDGTNFVINSATKKATDAEVTTGTDDTRYVTPKQLGDSRKIAILQTTRLMSGATGSVNLAHGLGVVPSYIEIHAKARYADSTSSEITIGSEGYADGTDDKCIYEYTFDAGSSIGKLTGNSATKSVFVQNGSSAGHERQDADITFDTTNLIFSRTRTTSGSDPASGTTISLTILAHA